MAMPSGGVSTNTSSLNLPAGFRFHPTDEELIVHYLMNQAASIPCPVPIIAEVNIYQWNPWDLPAKAVFGASGEWYFFSPRDRKYPNGARPNRAAGSGYWKATGTDKAILSSSTGQGQAQGVVGVKKALVFYGGRPPRGVKTDWIMHEYRLADAGKKRRGGGGGSMRLDDWVLCRIHKKSNDFQSQSQRSSSSSDHSTVEQGSPKPEPDLELHPQTTMSRSYSLTDLLNSFDCSALSQMLDDDQEALALPQQNPPLMYPTTTQTHQQQLNYNYNNHLKSLPHTNAAACSADEYLVANNNCNNNGVNKRKRMMMMDDIDGAAESFDDGSNGFSKKPKVLLPSDTRISSSYCNQQVVDTSGLLFQPYSSSSSSLLMSYPFLEMQ